LGSVRWVFSPPTTPRWATPFRHGSWTEGCGPGTCLRRCACPAYGPQAAATKMSTRPGLHPDTASVLLNANWTMPTTTRPSRRQRRHQPMLPQEDARHGLRLRRPQYEARPSSRRDPRGVSPPHALHSTEQACLLSNIRYAKQKARGSEHTNGGTPTAARECAKIAICTYV
jgi:hypothetical protein